MKPTTLFLILVMCLAASVALAASHSEIIQSIVAGGGGRSEAGSYDLDGTIGQPLIGTYRSDSSELCAGFPDCNIVCYVGIDDVQHLAGLWRGSTGPPYDCDGDGVATILDIMCWGVRLGKTCPRPF